ncbi:MAG: agmatine deiminase family protein [Candidatus Dadabacteria bacterium]|nr:agmatine deiminase family protein [Candidatus Dadabacteria bacterium]
MSDSSAVRYRLPAEWEPHDATWLVWPQNVSDWPGKFSGIERVYREIVSHLSESEKVRIIVDPGGTQKRAEGVLREELTDLGNVEFYECPTDRSWIRDSGPFFVRDGSGGLSVLDFGFNGWAKYPDWENDDMIPGFVAESLRLDSETPACVGKKIILEGGSIDVNGEGSLITTKQCLLSTDKQARNPSFGKNDYKAVFSEYFGATNVLWLNGGIEGDDTNGHVDDICRFTGPSTVVLCLENSVEDPNYRPLRENLEILQDLELEDGGKIEIVPLPMPSPLFFDGERLPATYANFYVSNEKILVPIYNDPKDCEALGVLSELFPKRYVVGINCIDLVWGFGAIHCMTKEEPLR